MRKSYQVIWYDGWTEYSPSFPSREAAESFIYDTGMDPEEVDIVEGE